MRTENIEVTFKIPIPVAKPDLNGVIYLKEAINYIETYKNKSDCLNILGKNSLVMQILGYVLPSLSKTLYLG